MSSRTVTPSSEAGEPPRSGAIAGLSSMMLDADVFRRRLPRTLQHVVVAGWYDFVSRRFGDGGLTFLDIGWAPLDDSAPALELLPADESERSGAALYHRVASAVDLKGANVLEVGCGRGGGASYVARYLGPAHVTAIDISGEAIAFCRRRHHVPNLAFRRGSADLTGIAPATFDAVVNVESSGSYPSMEHFLADVHRVLRPGGHFLFADMRESEKVGRLRRQLRRSGLEVIEEEDLSPNVVRAIEQDEPRKRAVFDATVPAVVRPFFNEFAAGTGTNFTYQRLRSGERVFLRFVLRRAAARREPR